MISFASAFCGFHNAFFELLGIVEWVDWTCFVTLIYRVAGVTALVLCEGQALLIEARHQQLLFHGWVIVLVRPSSWLDRISVVAIATLQHRFGTFSPRIRIKRSNGYLLNRGQVLTFIIILSQPKSFLIWIDTLHILHEVSSSQLAFKTTMALSATYGFFINVFIITLFYDSLLWVCFDQMIWRIGNLLILKLKLSLFQVWCVVELHVLL